jgi:hypothetical protein
MLNEIVLQNIKQTIYNVSENHCITYLPLILSPQLVQNFQSLDTNSGQPSHTLDLVDLDAILIFACWHPVPRSPMRAHWFGTFYGRARDLYGRVR